MCTRLGAIAATAVVLVGLLCASDAAAQLDIGSFNNVDVDKFRDIITGINPGDVPPEGIVGEFNGNDLTASTDELTVNGESFLEECFPVADIPGIFECFDDIGADALRAENDRFILALGLIFGAGVVQPGSNLSSASRTARLVFRELVMPPAEPDGEAESEDGERLAATQPRLFVTDLSYEKVDFEKQDGKGDVYSASFGVGADYEQVTLGLLVPYDHLDFSGSDIDRLGTTLFAQYHQSLPFELEATGTFNFNYLHTFLESPFDDVNTYGTGVGVSVKRDFGPLAPSVALSYQYATDDTQLVDDESHLIKAGGNLGYRLFGQGVVNVFLIGTFDVTGYDAIDIDEEYLDFGFDGSWEVSEQWSLSLGYKKVLALDDFESDMVFLGSALKF